YENHRDAAFEEILHLMHDYGIGVTTGDVPAGALPGYTAAIDTARTNAMTNLLWPTANVDEGTIAWIEELRTEGSLSQEYLASVIDSYYGYWGAHTETVGGMWGIYSAKTREDVIANDPMGAAVIKGYFSPVVTYRARIDNTFIGDFSLSFDISQPYTYKSQYLVNAQLTGANDSNLIGNQHDNELAGNSGVNRLDGKEGDDIAIFQGLYNEYSVSIIGSEIYIQDSVSGRDGVTTLVNIEAVFFGEQSYLFDGGELIVVEDDMDGL
ncbi:MAG: hypothetical protein KUG73_14090, partial [Pseudomonadales bacterium]|nr:hypothetical protein [Pseudomonadales bacterium]